MKILVSAACLALALSSCVEHMVVGHSPSVSEGRDLKGAGFAKIDISAPVDARISVGGAPSLSLEGYKNVMPYLHAEVHNNTLHIFTDERANIDVKENIIAHITIPELSSLELSGASDAKVSGVIRGQVFKLDLSGAGSVEIDEIHVQSFKSDLSGSANLLLRAGDIESGAFELSGSGAIKAFGVSQQQTSLDISGSAEAEVTVAKKLDIDISGAGSVSYKGHPVVRQDISGAGNIRDAN